VISAVLLLRSKTFLFIADVYRVVTRVVEVDVRGRIGRGVGLEVAQDSAAVIGELDAVAALRAACVMISTKMAAIPCT
jgi:hypothetical protein